MARKLREEARATPGAGGPVEMDGSGPEEGYPGPEGNNPNYPLSIRLDPLCVHPTEKIMATITSKPGGRLAFLVSHPDGDARGNYYIGPVPPTGTYLHTWVIAPDVPPGKGRALATGGDGKQSAGASQVFRVARAVQPCD